MPGSIYIVSVLIQITSVVILLLNQTWLLLGHWFQTDWKTEIYKKVTKGPFQKIEILEAVKGGVVEILVTELKEGNLWPKIVSTK